MKFFTLLLFALIGCEYQDHSFFKSNKIDTRSFSFGDRDVIDQHILSSNNTFNENLKAYYDKFVVVKNSSKYDTLVDYDSLYKEQNQTLNLRLDIYKQIKDADFDSFKKKEKIAFLINAYNFFAIEIVNKYLFDSAGNKLKSIADILGAGSFKAFNSINILIANESMTLDFLEKTKLKEILINQDGSIDARFHFAVICAAKGCPVLLEVPYEADKLDDQLNFISTKSLELTRNYEFLNDQTRLTNLFNWYRADFLNHKLKNGQKAGSIGVFINEFLPSSRVNNNVEFIEYNWDLNIL